MRRIVYSVTLTTLACLSAGDAQNQQEQQQQDNGWQEYTEGAIPTQERGNWYIKRQYVREAEDAYSQIRQIQKQVDAIRSDLVAKRDAVVKIIDDFYQNERIDAQELSQTVQEIVRTLEQRQKKQDTLSQQEFTWLQNAQSHKVSLQEIQEQIPAITKLREGAREAITIFDKQADAIDDYEDTAWQSYRKITDTVSDHVAQQEYQALLTALDNTQQTMSYIQSKLTPFLDSLSQQAKQQTQRLKQLIETIEKSSIQLRSQLQEEQQESSEPSDEAQQSQPEQQPEQQQQAEQTGWITWILTPFTMLGHGLYGIWTTLTALIGRGE